MGEHYFEPDPQAVARPRSVTFRLDGRDWTFASAAGVFSAERLDPGTNVLLRAAPTPAAGTLLDLGCGYGALACVLATRAPTAQVWAVDVNNRAIELAALNAASLGLSARVRAVRPEQVPPQLQFDEIWSNPPIRIGKQALHAMLTDWLGRLAPGGQAWLVVARNLGSDSLHTWLGEQGWSVERRTSVRGYRVLNVRRR